MQQDQTGQNSQSGRSVNYRSLGQIVRGLLFVFVGLFILFGARFGIVLRGPEVVRYIFGYGAIIYGAVRLVQGARSVMNR